MNLRKGDKVTMVDRYRQRPKCPCGKVFEPSWFDGMRGTVTATAPRVMVHLDGERLPMAFDERDLVIVDEPSQVSMTGAE